MPRTKIPAQRLQPDAAKLSKAEILMAIPRLEGRLRELEAEDFSSIDKDKIHAKRDRWQSEFEDILLRTFGVNTIEYNRYSRGVRFRPASFFIGEETPVEEKREALEAGRKKAVSALSGALLSLRDRLAEYESYERLDVKSKSSSSFANLSQNKRVFVVHGHDESARLNVTRFLERAGLLPIVLHEAANQGETIIEKFEREGDVGFAVILLTPDDTGSSVKAQLSKPRARQNVILELGYFLGRLGRSRVCALVRGELELPSDYAGVVYNNFDEAGAWMMQLGRELQAAGYDVDWNKIMRKN